MLISDMPNPEELCPLCGGVHITIEQLDALGLSELNVLRCGAEFTVPAKTIEDSSAR